MAVIEFDRVSKCYRLGASRTSLREAIAQTTRKLFQPRQRQNEEQLFWALRDVSFKVEQGEILGIIGHNGAGKSTTLKLLSRVAFPTSGQIRTRGRMAALIELGAGFHPDLSGRENIYLNGSILGLKKREIDAQFSDIVEFAGLEKFIDTPVKRYSSGMYVRLAFAVAAHVRADLLLIDEVLSVGDAAFQQKCLTKMNELHRNGATIVFISHNLWSVSTFCTRALLLRFGRIEAEGTPDDVIQIYRWQEREDALRRLDGADLASGMNILGDMHALTGKVTITKVELLNDAEQPEESFSPDSALIIRMHYVAPERIETPVVVIQIRRSDGLMCCFLTSEQVDDITDQGIHGEGVVEIRIDPLQLVPDIYTVETSVVDGKQSLVYATGPRKHFLVKGYVESSDVTGVFNPHTEWLHRVYEACK